MSIDNNLHFEVKITDEEFEELKRGVEEAARKATLRMAYTRGKILGLDGPDREWLERYAYLLT